MGMPVPHAGRVYFAGGGDYWWGKREAWLHCVDAGSAKRLWSYPLERHTMSTPAIHEGIVYVTDCAGNLHAINADTGEAHWTLPVQGEIWSSPLVADGKVYITTQRGELIVLATGTSLQERGRTKLDGQISATPVAANGVLYVTTPTTLYAVRQN
jgi:outer membrane protein assembly factor BamB